MSQIVKVCRNDVVRRIPVEAKLTLATLRSSTSASFPGLRKDFSFLWKDVDGDMVAILSEEDLQDALRDMEQRSITKSFSIVIIKNPIEEGATAAVPAESPLASSGLKVEIELCKGKGKVDKVRHISLPANTAEVTLENVVSAFPHFAQKVKKGKCNFLLQWTDDEEELVTVTTDAELQEALRCMQEHNLPLKFVAMKFGQQGRNAKQLESANPVEDTEESDSTECSAPAPTPAATATPAPTTADPTIVAPQTKLELTVCRAASDGKPAKARLISVDLSSDGMASFLDVRAATLRVYPGLERKVHKGKLAFTIAWTDLNGNTNTVVTDSQLQQALQYMQQHNLPVTFDAVEFDLKGKGARKGNKGVVQGKDNSAAAVNTPSTTTTNAAAAETMGEPEPAAEGTICIVRRYRTGNTQRVNFTFPTTVEGAAGCYAAFKAAAQASIAGLHPKKLEQLQLTWKDGATEGGFVIANDEELFSAVQRFKQQGQHEQQEQQQGLMEFGIELASKSNKCHKKDNKTTAPTPAPPVPASTAMVDEWECVGGDPKPHTTAPVSAPSTAPPPPAAQTPPAPVAAVAVSKPGKINVTLLRGGSNRSAVIGLAATSSTAAARGVSYAFNEILEKTARKFPGLGKGPIVVQFKDEDGDNVTVRSDAELTHAIECMQKYNLPVQFTVDSAAAVAAA